MSCGTRHRASDGDTELHRALNSPGEVSGIPLHNAPPPRHRSHFTYIIVLMGEDVRNAFNFYDAKLCQECFLSEGISKGKATHADIHVPPIRWTITLVSDRCVWCAEWRNKINSERKSVKDLQRGAFINEGLYQLGAHDCCVNISAVTQCGTSVNWTQRAAQQSVNSCAFRHHISIGDKQSQQFITHWNMC